MAIKMKAYIILISICFVLLPLTIKAQSYTPFPEQNTSWHSLVKWLHPQSGKGGECIKTWTRITGDTVISGNSYSILEDSVVRYGCLNGFLCTPILLGSTVRTLGYLRNDSINKKVFVRSVGSSFDALVYDFNMQIGDTVTTASKARSLYGLYPTTYVVDSTSVNFIAGKNRKVFYIYDPQKHWNRFEIIEGIGSSGGFLSSHLVDNLHRTELICFNNLNTGNYSPTNSCPLSTNIIQPSIKDNELQVYPNPTTGTINIKSQSKISEVELFNINGLRLNRIQFKDEEVLVDLPSMKGVYLIKIYFLDSEESTIKRVVHL